MKTALSPDPASIAPAVLERIARRADGWLARAPDRMKSVIEDWHIITRRLEENRPAAG